MRKLTFRRLLRSRTWTQNLLFGAVIGLTVITGLEFLAQSRAASPFIDVEPELGTLDANAAIATDISASGSKAVRFDAGATSPGMTSCLTGADSTSIFKVTAANGFVNNPTSGYIYTNKSIPSGRIFDATGTTWLYGLINSADASQIYGVSIRGGDNVCWSGGRFVGTNIDSEHPIWETWHDLNGFRLGGLKNFVFEKLYIRNFGDLLNISDDDGEISDNWLVRDSLLRHSHDDCIQNDKMATGKISNSFLDGCYTGISARMSSGDASDGVINGAGKTISVENSLIWLQPMTPVYKGQNPGHGNLLKWENDYPAKAMNLSLKNVTIMTWLSEDDEMDNNAGSKLVTCENVTIIWAGPGAFPGTGWPAGCVTVLTGTAGRALWLQKVNEWYAAHPQFADLKQADDYYFSYHP